MKKQFFLLLTGLSLLPTSMQYAMQPVAVKTTESLIKYLAKKSVSGTMTGLHWTISAGAPLFTGIVRAKALLDEKKAFANLANANDEITQFITTSLETTHNKKIDAVKINPAFDILHMPIGTLNKNIILSPSTAREIEKALKTNDLVTLNKWQGTLEHEGNHIKNNDFVWRTLADLTLPFVTHGSVKVIRNAIPIAKKTRSFLGEQLIKIPTGIGKGLITSASRGVIYRAHEQAADNGVSNNIDSLTGMKTVLEEENEKQKNILRRVGWSPKSIDTLFWAGNFFDHHPLTDTRIEKLNQRIALLDKQSKHDKPNNL